MSDVSPLLDGFAVITSIPVLWGDEDAFGHVNNVVFLRWCEEARVVYLRRIASWTDMPAAGVGPIIAAVHCDYKAQLRYPDTVDIGTRVDRIGNSSIGMHHLIVSREQNIVVAEADSTVVLFDYGNARPVTVADDIRARIGDLERTSFAEAASAE